MTCDASYRVIDTSDLTIDEVVAAIVNAVRAER
jgi:cytidylate kinase